MSYFYQWYGAMPAYAFLYGCMLGLLSPRTYFPTTHSRASSPVEPSTSPTDDDARP